MQKLQSAPSPELIRALQGATDLVFDVDLTLTFRQHNLDPQLAGQLLLTDKRRCIASSRAQNELDESIDPCGFSRGQIFNGPVILEDGAVVLLPNAPSPTINVSAEVVEAVNQLREAIRSQILPLAEHHPYGQFLGIDNPLVHLPTQYNYLASLSVWQRALGNEKPYERVMQRVHELATELGVRQLLHLHEIGDGTLRASAPGLSKGNALQQLQVQGVLDLSKVAYFGDGSNDVPAAEKVRQHGGIVVCVDTHCAALRALANFEAPVGGQGPQFVLQIMQALNRSF
jgi:hydroxymethylpyrimidine pyrophosphatase-like HAD family hydrolase